MPIARRILLFIVSFPEGTDHEAAYRAGRAWAEELLESGRFSEDSFDYYTALHTDRAHPHMHVVVNRRGLDHGAWLKVFQRSVMNYDSMRELVVEVAEREGIHLETSTRLARGEHDRPVQDAEYRRAAEENRAPVAPAHTRETSIRAAAAMIYYARLFAEDAERMERENPEQAARLRQAAEAISHGRALSAELWGQGKSEQEKTMASARIEEKRVEVRENFADMDRSVASIEDNTERMKLLRQVAAMKAEALPVMRDPGALRDFARPDPGGRYAGMGPAREAAPDIAARQDQQVRQIASRYGVDPEATIERYAGGVPSKGLADQFAASERCEIDETRRRRGETEDRTPEGRLDDLKRMHREIAEVYREGRARAERESSQATGRAHEAADHSADRAATTPQPEAPPPSELSEKARARLAREDEERARLRRARDESRARGDDDRPRDTDRDR